MMRRDLKSGLLLPGRPRLCSMFPVFHGVAGAAGGGGSIAKVQQQSNSGNTLTNVTATYDSTPTENNLLVAVGTSSDGATHTLSITGWTKAFGDFEVTYGAGGFGNAMVFYKIAGGAEGTGVQLDASVTANGLHLHIYEFSGLKTASVLDVTQTSDEGSDNALIVLSGTTAATAQADALAVSGHVIADDNFDAGPTMANSFTLGEETIAGNGVPAAPSTSASAYKILSATGTQSTSATFAGGGAEQRWGCIAVFKGA